MNRDFLRLKHTVRILGQHAVSRFSHLLVAKVEVLWEILRFPLLFAFLATLPEQLLYAWVVFGAWGVIGYAILVSLPLCRIIEEREKNYVKLLLRQ
jgi:hypothetical protein